MEELQTNKRIPLSVFISYAHEDEPLRQQLDAHLSLLRRQGLVADWHDRQIMPGTEWAQEIDKHLETASIILLLVSADFVASDYCYDKEMKRALERHKLGEARVIPIILRPCDWQSSPFARLQSLPRDGKAVTTWQNSDEAFLAIARGLRQVIEQQNIPTNLLPELEQKNRRSLIKRVRTTWIEGLLEHSLHEATKLELHLQERPDVLANPWRLQVQELDRPPRPLPAGTSIVQVYDQADGELLILGEPGAGKTTLLLELARTLLDRAQADERHHIPVVFNLSSWAQKHSLLSKWLVEELRIKYQVSRKLGRSWIASGWILPLLDGLDEVPEEARAACAQAINTYHQNCLESGSAPLVICCRSEEYMALPTRVNLHQAVSILPLTPEQIEHYFQGAKGQFAALRQALQDDPELYELAHRPLMLNIFALAYREAAPEDLPAAGTREEQRRQVFAAYVERMFARRGMSKRAPREQMLRWLTFLATQMQKHTQTVFYLEHLQSDWLGSWFRRILYWLSVGLIVGGLAELVSELVLGLVWGLWLYLIHWIGSLHEPFLSDVLLPLLPLLSRVVEVLVGPAVTVVAQIIGVVFLIIGLTFGLSRIRPREVLTWSWKGTKLSFIFRLVVPLSVAVLIGLIVRMIPRIMSPQEYVVRIEYLEEKVGIPADEIDVLISALTSVWVSVLVLIIGLILGLAPGFSTNLTDDHIRFIPNRGIWRSAKNGLVLGFVFGVVCELILWLIIFGQEVLLAGGYLFAGCQEVCKSVEFADSVIILYMSFTLLPLLFVALPVGLGVGLVGGLGTFFQHFALRFWLWRTKYFPWNAVAFLDEVTERLLLRRVGGGYIFVHRLLLDYFASLEKNEP